MKSFDTAKCICSLKYCLLMNLVIISYKTDDNELILYLSLELSQDDTLIKMF